MNSLHPVVLILCHYNKIKSNLNYGDFKAVMKHTEFVVKTSVWPFKTHLNLSVLRFEVEHYYVNTDFSSDIITCLYQQHMYVTCCGTFYEAVEFLSAGTTEEVKMLQMLLSLNLQLLT